MGLVNIGNASRREIKWQRLSVQRGSHKRVPHSFLSIGFNLRNHMLRLEIFVHQNSTPQLHQEGKPSKSRVSVALDCQLSSLGCSPNIILYNVQLRVRKFVPFHLDEGQTVLLYRR